MFQNRPYLSTVIIGSGVTTIESQAFMGCGSLTSISLPANVHSLGTNVFAYCTSLTSINFPSTLTNVPDGMFAYSAITSMTIPDSVTSIGNGSFANCNSLTSISIGSSVASIGTNAFLNCPLQNLTIPDSVTSIQPDSFAGCRQLRSVTLGTGVTTIFSGMFQNCPYLANVTIGSGVTTIADSAFAYSSLTSITIPANVRSIGNNAFAYCTLLASANIPGSLTTIADGLFANTGLTAITIPETIIVIGNGSFANCNSLTSVGIGHHVTTIGANAFLQCPIQDLLIPDSVTSIQSTSFGGCRQVRSVVLGNGITTIFSGMFQNCPFLTTISIGNNVTSIGDQAFFSSALTSITIPANVRSIGTNAFAYCTLLSWASIPDSITAIPDGIFTYTALTSMTIADTVTSIGNGSFANCNSLTTVVIGHHVTTIGTNAFLQCPLQELVIPDSVTSIQSTSFGGCRQVRSVVLGSGITTIFSGMFQSCPYLANVTIGSGVTTIEDSAFMSSSLTSIVIPANVRSIGANAFAYCTLLDSVSLPSTLTALSDGVFTYTALTSITIPDGVARIGNGSFAYCSSLLHMQFEGDAPVCGTNWNLGHAAELAGYYWYNRSGWTNPWEGIAMVKMGSGPSIPSVPRNAAILVRDHEFIISWAVPADDGGSSLTGYRLFVGLGTAPDTVLCLCGPDQTSLDLTTLTLGGHYAFAVVATNAIGASGMSNLVEATFATTPSAPLTPAAVCANGQVTVSWSAPLSDGFSSIDYYVILQNGVELASHPTQVSAALSGLAKGVNYTFAIEAHNALGLGAASLIIYQVPATCPGAPLLHISEVDDDNVTLTWTAPADDGGSTILGYEIFYGNASTPLTRYGGLLSNSTFSLQITGLEEGVQYSFAARAVNGINESELSNTLSATLTQTGGGIILGPAADATAAIVAGAGLGLAGAAVASGIASGGESVAQPAAQSLLGKFFQKLYEFFYGLGQKLAKYYSIKRFKKSKVKKNMDKHIRLLADEPEVHVRKSFWSGFSLHEVGVIAAASVILALTFLIVKKMDLLQPGNYLVYVVVAGFVVILADLVQHLVTHRYGGQCEYQVWLPGVGIILLTSIIFGVAFSSPARLVVDKENKLTARQEAFVHLAAPLACFAAFLAFALLLPLGGTVMAIGLLGCSMNLLSAAYSVMPLEPMNGPKILKWNKKVYVLLAVPMLLLYFAMAVFVFA
jgi:Zn-dependent protease